MPCKRLEGEICRELSRILWGESARTVVNSASMGLISYLAGKRQKGGAKLAKHGSGKGALCWGGGSREMGCVCCVLNY